MKKTCSIVWDGLRSGPKYAGRDPALRGMTREFLASRGQMRDPVEFGEEMRDFAEERGYDVEDNVYLDGRVYESAFDDSEADFVEALKAGPVEFSYTKKDGSVHRAVGTLNPELIGHGATEKKVEDGKKKRFVPPTIQVYFDFGAQGFRSFVKDNFIEYKASV